MPVSGPFRDLFFSLWLGNPAHECQREYVHRKNRRKDRRNMLNQFSRTELLLGKDAMGRLEKSRVAIFGVGGVGGYAAEALASIKQTL